MSRPIESDYASHVAYCRALEEYCDELTRQRDEAMKDAEIQAAAELNGKLLDSCIKKDVEIYEIGCLNDNAEHRISELEQQLAAAQAHIAEMQEAMGLADNLIDHQFTGTSAGMTALQIALDEIHETLAIESPTDALREHDAKLIDDFVHLFKRHVGGDGELWLHELEDFADKIRKGEPK